MKNYISKILLMAVVALLTVSCSSDKKQYAMSPEDALSFFVDSLQGSHKYVLSEEELGLLVNGKVENTMLVDVRSAHRFIEYHLQNSINIPLTKKFLDNENMLKIKKSQQNIVLIGEDSKQAFKAFMILKQMGVGNIRIAEGGVSYAQKIENNDIDIFICRYKDEEPQYDYQKIMSEASKGGAPAETEPKPAKKPVVKRQKKAVSGGCG